MKWLLRNIIVISSLLLFWQGIVTLAHFPDYILPTPYAVASILYHQAPLLAKHAGITLFEILMGFGLGIIFGCGAGFAIAFFRPMKYWFLPLLLISQALPTFAIAPILIIWLGYGLAAKVATTILMIFFPIASAFYDGLNQTPTDWLTLANSMHASRWRVFCFIRIPAALPSLATGLRLAAALAPMGAVVGEWVGSSQGLGYLMLNANARLQIDLLFATLIVIIIASLLLYFSVDRTLTKWLHWQDH